MPAEDRVMLSLSGLVKVFGGLTALDGVSLQIPTGAVFGLIGPNGAGKTTLFNVVSGVYSATAGQVHLQGRLLTGLPQHRIAALGVARTFQNLQIFKGMTVLENVLAGCHRHGHRGVLSALLSLPTVHAEERRLRERAREALEFVGLAAREQERAADLPPGLQRQVEIARALALEPRLMLLDEPAAGLTTRETEALGELIARLAQRGLTTLLVEHDMSLVMGACQTVAVLDRGALLTMGEPTEVQNNPQVIAAYLGEEEPA